MINYARYLSAEAFVRLRHVLGKFKVSRGTPVSSLPSEHIYKRLSGMPGTKPTSMKDNCTWCCPISKAPLLQSFLL